MSVASGNRGLQRAPTPTPCRVPRARGRGGGAFATGRGGVPRPDEQPGAQASTRGERRNRRRVNAVARRPQRLRHSPTPRRARRVPGRGGCFTRGRRRPYRGGFTRVDPSKAGAGVLRARTKQPDNRCYGGRQGRERRRRVSLSRRRGESQSAARRGRGVGTRGSGHPPAVVADRAPHVPHAVPKGHAGAFDRVLQDHARRTRAPRGYGARRSPTGGRQERVAS